MSLYRWDKGFSARKAKYPNNPAALYLSDNEEVFPFHSPFLDLLLDCIPYFFFIPVEIGTVKEAVACINSKLHHLFHLSRRSLKANTVNHELLRGLLPALAAEIAPQSPCFQLQLQFRRHLHLKTASAFQANSIFAGKGSRAERTWFLRDALTLPFPAARCPLPFPLICSQCSQPVLPVYLPQTLPQGGSSVAQGSHQ